MTVLSGSGLRKQPKVIMRIHHWWWMEHRQSLAQGGGPVVKTFLVEENA